MPRVVRCDAGAPLEAGVLEDAVGIIASGGLIVYPAGTLYGLGAGICSAVGVERVNMIKARPAGMPLSVMATGAQLADLCSVPEGARRFIESGESRITMVLPASDAISGLLAGNGTVGVRLPCSELTRSLVEAAGPITATSANMHGGKPPERIDDAAAQLGEGVSLYLDAGPQSGKPSTVADFSGAAPRVLREGALPSTEVLGYE